jgi:FKBP-type peptidyl-prolyl cis-trans isomerase FklB
MKRAARILPALIVVSLAGCATETALKTDTDKQSYAFGYQLGSTIKPRAKDLDPAVFARGVKEALAGTPAMTDADMQLAIQGFEQAQMQKRIAQGEENKKKGEAFLAENRKKPGWKETASGLQYKVETEGAGKSPKPEDTVKVHYRGTLIDGTEFDSSYKRNQPATFPVHSVIQGWQELLPMMKVGAKWQVALPSKLAYGERGAGTAIGVNETLLFEVELLEIKEAPKAEAPKPAAPAKPAAPKKN